jgi:valyl-tRNA synthetase
VKDAASSDPTGSHVPEDAGSKVGPAEAGAGEKKVKSEKERTNTL